MNLPAWTGKLDLEKFLNNTLQVKHLSKFGRIGRSILKRFMYSQLAILTGLKIALGKENPLVRFTIENDPPSVYWVFRIKPSEVERLVRKLGLPEQFELCPIQCLTTDEPEYLLTVNAYRVSGLANGIRAEWSIFVRDEKNIPRFFVVDARSAKNSMDPVDVITRASKVIHEKRDGIIFTQIGEGENVFEATITLPHHPSPVTASAEWVSANDYIYWGNGICDRTFYDAGLANAEQYCVDNENSKLQDNTFWNQFIEPEPVHVLVLQNSIEFVISPWENIDRLHIQ